MGMQGAGRGATTSGTEHAGREGRDLAPGLETYELSQEVERLRAEPQWTDGDRNSKTLIKAVGLRVVLTALRAGALMDNDQPDEAVTIQVLHGAVEVTAAGESLVLPAGRLAALGGGVPWRIAAHEDSVLVLSVGRDLTLQEPSTL